jgi:hypothetical protein
LQAADLALKRVIEIVAAGAGLLVLAPLFLEVATLIRATSRGPALLCQTRNGKDGKRFGCATLPGNTRTPSLRFGTRRTIPASGTVAHVFSAELTANCCASWRRSPAQAHATKGAATNIGAVAT